MGIKEKYDWEWYWWSGILNGRNIWRLKAKILSYGY